MDVLILLRDARFAGLRVTASGNHLVVQGPRRLQPMARLLLSEKPEVMRALAEEQEVAWRVDAMRLQVPATGAIPLLLARPEAVWGSGIAARVATDSVPTSGIAAAVASPPPWRSWRRSGDRPACGAATGGTRRRFRRRCGATTTCCSRLALWLADVAAEAALGVRDAGGRLPVSGRDARTGARTRGAPLMALAVSARPSVHVGVAQYLIYVRRSYKEATAADVSDEMQEAACRALLPAGASVRVISDSGGHQSGFSAARDGYQALLASARGRARSRAIAVYDLSRLARNARLMLDLQHELERRQVPLLVANLPGARFDGATGRYMFGQLCLAAQLQRDLDSERMTGMQHRLFEDGRHRGHDPLGYRSLRTDAGDLVHPRQLVDRPRGGRDRAAGVARARAALLRRGGRDPQPRGGAAPGSLDPRGHPRHRAPGSGVSRASWSRSGAATSVPDATSAILSDAEYRRAMAAIAARTLVGNKPRPFRTYALRGLLYCSCGTRMRGEAHVQRGTEIRYYRCPTLGCHARRCPADTRRNGGARRDRAGHASRSQSSRRRAPSCGGASRLPAVAVAGRQRARLLTRLEQLQKQHAWGDLSDAAYQAQRDATRAALAELPDGDRITAFDAYRARILALPDAIAAASGARREELCRIVIERVVVRDRQVQTIEWQPPARPFFARPSEERQRAWPQGDSNP